MNVIYNWSRFAGTLAQGGTIAQAAKAANSANKRSALRVTRAARRFELAVERNTAGVL